MPSPAEPPFSTANIGMPSHRLPAAHPWPRLPRAPCCAVSDPEAVDSARPDTFAYAEQRRQATQILDTPELLMTNAQRDGIVSAPFCLLPQRFPT